MGESKRKEENGLLFINRQWTEEEVEMYSKFPRPSVKKQKNMAQKEQNTPISKTKATPAY